MRTFFLSLTLSGIYFIGVIGVNSHPSLADPPSTSRRAEPVLQEQAKSQGYQLSKPELDPQDPDREVYLYTVNYQKPNDSQWHNLCQPDADNLAKAMLLSGEWDETGTHGTHIDNERVTVACTSGVLVKCVRWGYKPWQTVQGVSLRDYHQTCTRMARADYCGNSTSHTRDGTAIDLYDRLGIQQQTEDSGMVFEAAWGTDGAVFIDRTRYSETLAQIQQECPQKLETRLNRANQSLTKTQIQQQNPTALIFNDSFVNKTFHNPRK